MNDLSNIKPDLPRPIKAEDPRYTEASPHEADGGHIIGIDPRRISKEDLATLPAPKSPIKAIRANCLDCSGHSYSEVTKCVHINCPLWPYRNGKNVYHSRAK